jgi:hypothetical protein
MAAVPAGLSRTAGPAETSPWETSLCGLRFSATLPHPGKWPETDRRLPAARFGSPCSPHGISERATSWSCSAGCGASAAAPRHAQHRNLPLQPPLSRRARSSPQRAAHSIKPLRSAQDPDHPLVQGWARPQEEPGLNRPYGHLHGSAVFRHEAQTSTHALYRDEKRASNVINGPKEAEEETTGGSLADAKRTMEERPAASRRNAIAEPASNALLDASTGTPAPSGSSPDAESSRLLDPAPRQMRPPPRWMRQPDHRTLPAPCRRRKPVGYSIRRLAGCVQRPLDASTGTSDPSGNSPDAETSRFLHPAPRWMDPTIRWMYQLDRRKRPGVGPGRLPIRPDGLISASLHLPLWFTRSPEKVPEA